MTFSTACYADEDIGRGLENTVYVLDSATNDLSLTFFPWADFRRTKVGIKTRTQADLRGPIPTGIHITDACQHDERWLDEIIFEPRAFHVTDRGYMDVRRLDWIARVGAFSVTQAKDNLHFFRQRSLQLAAAAVRIDQTSKPTVPKARKDFPSLLRRICYFDAETGHTLIFLTNHLEIPALTVAMVYSLRWRIELFFRWIQVHLRIQHYYGASPNAVETQIWIAITAYLIIAILHKQLHLSGTLHRTLLHLNIHPFEKVPLDELFTETGF